MKRGLLRVLIALGGLLLLVVVAVALFLRGSAPRLDGELTLTGLAAPVTVTRDALGVPVIHAGSRSDAVRALGFLHGQDRFFEMDLMRRMAAGELSALVGAGALKLDEAHRVYRLRAVARHVLAAAPPARRAVLTAYAQGVNAGLQALHSWPFEYGILMTRPQAWTPEDSVLVIYAMYFQLQAPADRREADLATLYASLPPALAQFLDARGTRWDAPLIGTALEHAAIPGSDVVDLRARPPMARNVLPPPGPPREIIGSNNFAVDAAHSADGHAAVVNDMHLGLSVPNIWYRAQLVYPDLRHADRNVTVTGVTLPGLPVIVTGSNGRVAWGFTNSYGDWVDLVRLHPDPQQPDRYHTADGWRGFTHHTEIIHVKHGKDVRLDVRDTIWGPVTGKDRDGVPRVSHWVASDPVATNLELGTMDAADNIAEAMAVANRAGIPAQNFVVADSGGHIAWTIAGRIPLRHGFDPRRPAYWDTPGTGWNGWLDPARYPRIVNPKSGRLWTANARVVDGAMLAQIGDGGYALGARAQQIRDDLMARETFSPGDLLAIELDDRAVFLGRWRSLLLRLLTPERLAQQPERAAFRQYVEQWGARAATDSVGYRLVRDFRLRVDQVVFTALTAPCKKADPDFDYHSLPQREAPLWALVTQQPVNLLDAAYRNWDSLLLAAVDHVAGELWLPDSGLATRTWGEHNTVRIRQPLSAALPLVGRWLDMAPVSLPGDSNMPRVQGVAFGASERMVVEPGYEQNGIFEMPTGQSGYPFSPFYRNSQPAWAQGEPSPFLPGASVHTLILKPEYRP
ncbi:MAG TPA: penicillin acylase family protein [Gammaproteobacteria bacterium]|nr:penicillin acylase family protein [Gammaproteobacteria bacterium]